MSEKPITLVWFRRDLRLSDNPALHHAIETGGEIIPVYIHSPEEEGEWRPGEASNWWLHHSLVSLQNSIREKGANLIVCKGGSKEVLDKLILQSAAKRVFWNRLYDPEFVKRDTDLKSYFVDRGIEVHSFNGALLKEPSTFFNQSKKPFQVFTPFWNALQKVIEVHKPLPEPEKIAPVAAKFESLNIEELSLLPRIRWDKEFYETWNPGEKNSKEALKRFLKNAGKDYGVDRDIPSIKGTSRLSPALHFGEISPNEIFYLADELNLRGIAGIETYLKEIGWREFAHHLLFHFSNTPNEPLRSNFKKFKWADDPKSLRAWQRGQTGYPIVDAGMRELWVTGWMHNRVRMIVSSFLVKDLLINWLEGAKWFWDTLVDASLASNTMGWQWSGGCGADAAPFFRIFNPITQGEKFDANGEYVRKWVPELKNLPDKYLHKPWEAPEKILKSANLTLGKDYPHPIVDHAEARGRALYAFDKIKG